MTTEYTAAGKPYVHYHAAHCESGVTSAFFRDKGVDISEPMVFGIGSGIFFGYLPFLKAAGMRVSTFRSQPGAVFRKAARRLGGDFVVKTYRNPQKGMDELRRVLKTGQIVGLKTDLERARFARGPMESHGYMYYLTSVNPHPDLRQACIKGMKDSCNLMLRTRLPIFGVRGIRFQARKIIDSPDKHGFNAACRLLADVIRWLEDTGTGGAGFRYMYAAFLQEAAELLRSAELAGLSEEMTAIGHDWRKFSLAATRIIEQRKQFEQTFADAGGLMHGCADREEKFFKNLRKVAGKMKV